MNSVIEILKALLSEVEEIRVPRCDRGPMPFESDTSRASLRVDLGSFPLDEVTRWLEPTGKSGRLEFRSDDCEKHVYLHKGEIVFASSNQEVDRLGECLIRAGVIQLDQLREAERCYKPPARFGRVLVERGFLTPRELWNGVKYQVEEIVRSLFTYGSGEISFFEGVAHPDNVVRLSLSSARLAREGLMRKQELEKFSELLCQPEVELHTRAEVAARLSDRERKITDALGDGCGFEALAASVGWERHELLRNLQLLRLVGALELRRNEVRNEFLGEADLEAYLRDELAMMIAAGTKLIASLAREIANLEGEAAVRERLSRTLEEASARFPELLSGVPLNSELSLDRQVLVDRANLLSADAEEYVSAGLGELVAYLEFELKNHPGIASPDELLSGLRAGSAWVG